MPRHDITVASGAQTALQDFVPADQPAAIRGEKLVHPPDELALQLMLVLEAQLAHARLHRRAGASIALLRASSPPMWMNGPGNSVEHLVQHVLQELRWCSRSTLNTSSSMPHSARRTTQRGSVLPSSGYAAIAACACARHLDLRHDGDVPRAA